MLRSFALLLLALLATAPLAVAAEADLADADGDALPDEAESNVCGRILLNEILLGVVLFPWAGECDGWTNYHARSASDLEDSDGDGFGDLVETGLCYYEDQNGAYDGACADGDYTAPNLTP